MNVNEVRIKIDLKIDLKTFFKSSCDINIIVRTSIILTI